MPFFKDKSLDDLAQTFNVAQFVSFEPSADGFIQRYSRIVGYQPNHQFASLECSVAELLRVSVAKSVNIRSFIPDDPQSKEFIYGLKNAEEIITHMWRLRESGLYIILNETIDVKDGGVSGVVQSGVIEFSPYDTPRCVEKPGTASLPFSLGLRVLEMSYGFLPELCDVEGQRLEFSIHPQPQGWMQTHTLLWEQELGVATTATAALSWPNNFSRMIGDKAFGLLIAQALDYLVPKTTVINRKLAPFVFGKNTNSAETWIRTAPIEPQPGLFTTAKGWIDPFKLMAQEDPEGNLIASVLSQAAVPATYSGASITGSDDQVIIEGTMGEGDRFMLGLDLPQSLPEYVIDQVKFTFDKLKNSLGPVRFEWVFDGNEIWIVQLHRGGTETDVNVIVPGDANHWIKIQANLPLEVIRQCVKQISDGDGLIIVGDIGLTSHIADVVRKAGHPAKLERNQVN